jgi:hypothetical protein
MLKSFILSSLLFLQWNYNDPSENVIVYNIYSSTNLCDWLMIGTTNINKFPIIINTNERYRVYFVTASNSSGESLPIPR